MSIWSESVKITYQRIVPRGRNTRTQPTCVDPEGLDWLQSLKQFFVNVSYHILLASLNLMAIRVRLANSIWYDTFIKYCFKDWSQSTDGGAGVQTLWKTTKRSWSGSPGNSQRYQASILYWAIIDPLVGRWWPAFSVIWSAQANNTVSKHVWIGSGI